MYNTIFFMASVHRSS